MPKVDGVGYGDCTEIKIKHFSKIVAMHLAISQAVLNKHRSLFNQNYRYIELTAGKGISPDGTIGSPIAFLEKAEAETFTIPYRADFIECEPQNIGELKQTLEILKIANGWKGTEWHFHNGKYQDEIPSLLKSKSNEFGLVFVDPSGDLPDFDTVQYIAKIRPKMEILIYLSSTNVKRIYQYTDKHLTNYIDSIGKKYWLIRKAINWDQFKWTFLLGSNAPDLFKDYKQIDFYRLDSQYGQSIFEKLNLTEKEQVEYKQYKLDLDQ
jgi:three-Cys-motif partner protein